MFRVELHDFGTTLKKVFRERHRAGLKEKNGRGASEGEVSLLLTFFDRFASGEGLMNRSHAGGTDLHADDRSV